MTDWTTIPDFTDGDVVRAAPFEDLASNLEILHGLRYFETAGPGIPSGAWTFGVSASWFDIDATYFTQEFSTDGNPILVVAVMRYSHSALAGTGLFRFMLDNVTTSGMVFACRDDADIQAIYVFSEIITTTEGSHTLHLQVQNQAGSGNVEIWKDFGTLNIRILQL